MNNILNELIIDTIEKGVLVESEASQAAKRMGLIYKRWGRWAHPNNPNKIVAKTVNNKLVRLNPKSDNTKTTKITNFEKKAIQKDNDIAKGMLEKEGPAILSKLQKSINNSSDNDKLAKLYTLRDSVMDLIPLEDSGKVPHDVKTIYSNHKIKQMAQLAIHHHGSVEGAVKAAKGSTNNENHPLVSRILSNSNIE